MTSKQEQFIQDLVQFYRNRGIVSANSSQFVARLNGKNVDLCELYSRVLEYGGSYKVNQANLWDEIYFKLFKTNYVGANFAVALRQIYNRYLLQYEKSCSGNFSNEQWNEEDDDENAIFSNSHSSVQYSNNHHQAINLPPTCDYMNNVTDFNGQVHNDSKLYCSLLSGLPNELNFAYNVATILSNCHRFDWHNDYKFINVLVESIKSYCCVCDHFDEELTFGREDFTEEDEILKLEKVIKSSFNRIFYNKNFDTIMKKSLHKPNGIIANKSPSETSFKKFEMPNFKKNIDFIEKKCNCYIQFWYQICLDEDLLYLTLNDSSEELDFNTASLFKDFPQQLIRKIGQRVSLIADIIRNVSFTYNQNTTNHVAMTPLLKFLTLLLRSDNVKFVNISFDILSNLAPALSFSFSKPYEEEYLNLLHILFKNIVDTAMNSNNIHDTTKAFEVMARYISSTNNEANVLLETHFHNDKIYERITQLLTCHYDISLVLALLEFCLVLSECRPHILINSDSKTFLKILVNLLNCQAAQHFTTGALEKIKIIDTRPADEVKTNLDSINNNKSVPTQQQNSNVTVSNQQMTPTKSEMAVTVTNHVQQNNLNAMDNESFAINWLRITYEEAPSNCSLKVNDIYAEYVKYCCRNLRRNVIAAQSFNFLLKRCFPVCNINQAQLIEGLVLKNQQTAVISNQEDQIIKQKSSISSTTAGQNSSSSQMSPILKAHLSTPPKTLLGQNDSPLVQNVSTPTTSTNASTLIKSLLANKLRNNQQISISSQQQSNVSTTPQSTQVVFSQNNQDVQKPQSADINIQQQQQQKNIIITQNPATSFALTPTLFSNNIIVPTSIQSQVPNHLPGSQQIFLVRTIITAPGQQNANSPVRLLVPASMITQPRLPTPNINGIATGGVTTSLAAGNIVQTIPNNIQTTAPILQAQQQLANTTQNILQQNTVPIIMQPPPSTQVQTIQSQAPIIKNSSIANSSPLLNVLLDKGKLPDFPNHNSSSQQTLTSSLTQQSTMPNNSTTLPSSTVIQQPNTSQPKMFLLAQNPPKLTNTNIPIVTTNEILSSPQKTNILDNKLNFPLVTTSNHVVNGDMRTTIKVNNSVRNVLDNSSSLPELNKRLKTTHSTEQIPGTIVMKYTEETKTIVDSSAALNHNPKTINNSLINNTSSNVDSKQSTQAEVTNSQPRSVMEFECQWNNCQMKFSRPSDVFYHVHSQHIMIPSCPNFMNCLWGGSEGRGPGCLSKRPKLSLLTHLQDFHCNPLILKQESVRKKQLALMGTSNIVLPQPPAHPGYAQNAAMLAIRRYTNKTVESSEPITPLTPLTVSIRLTSALILRNLAKRSHFIKKSLELFESQLCEISTAEGRDESRTIAQCLAVLNENK